MSKTKVFRFLAVFMLFVCICAFALSGCTATVDPGNGSDNTDNGSGSTDDNTGNSDDNQDGGVTGYQVTYTFEVNTTALTAEIKAVWVGDEVDGIAVDYSTATVPDKTANKSADDGFKGSNYLLVEASNHIKITIPEDANVAVYISHTNSKTNRTLYITKGEHDAPDHSNKEIIVAQKSVDGTKGEHSKLYAVTSPVASGDYYLSADTAGGMHVYGIIVQSEDFKVVEPDNDTGNKPDDSTGGSGSSGGSSGSTGNSDEPKVEVFEDEKNGKQPEVTDTSIWLSPTGSDSNDGSQSKPLYSLSKAVEKATAGTTIFCIPGVYNYSQRVDLAKSGTADKPIIIQAYNWGEVEFNFSSQLPGNNNSNYVGLYLKGDYWKLHGITVCYAGDNGIKIEGSYNYLGRCVTHHNLDTGIQLGFGHDKKNPGGLECSNNLIENCDSYLNCDHDANFGADADGFACKMYAGINNAFRGCRAWRNADDNWDLYEMEYSVLIEDCWAWEAGKKSDFTGENNWVQKRIEPFSDITKLKYKGDGSWNGNGNGIKLGGNSSNGQQLVKNCVSFGHNKSDSVKGFDQNHNAGGIYITNCVAWDNGYNYMLDDSSKLGHAILNSLSFYNPPRATRNPGELVGNGVVLNCNFDLNSAKGDLKHNTTYGTLTADDFITLSEEAAIAPRQADGSLPNNGFARLKSTSPFYGKGMGLI